ncbi:hypothetical protein ABB37_08421 [Leptomonas pyrrhocoris]|uniref:Uncharacterized protein n=1 Tax=Leptomonas pyrrhocoris TaxID=157538 RepID=A0A0M9FTB9_LEPPY|nr:hypothetical protein ABB37_08421 [Leptomonas pyrrhocoris]KPA75529.1 hypothetical protein ABB37_08421 [Leptomonas pyrrhocoris]|eukprot:XP_015653968.1 hypothetical protein ABB37_08421 [Leptomonas pyrrhocoris]
MPPRTSPFSSKAAAAPSTSTSGFASFVLERVAHNPFLIHETPRSLRLTGGVGGVPTTLDPDQRDVLLHADAPPNSANAATAAVTAAAVTAVLQRALVDAPLLPVGGSHLLYELVWSNFVACAEAAKQVGCYKQALELHGARAMTAAAVAPAAATATSDAGVDTSSSTNDSSLVESVFGASPLVPGSQPASSPQGGSGHSLFSPEELSTSIAPDVLHARLAQSQTRLAELKVELARSLAKMRCIAQDLDAYDATPIEELRRQREAATTALMTPVVVPPSLREGGAVPPPAVVVVVDGEQQDRKRQRTAE